MNFNLQGISQLARSLMNRRSLTVLSIGLILIALPLTVYLNQQRQDIRQHASSGNVCTQAEFTDLTSDQFESVYCLSTDPVCVVAGTTAAAGGATFDGARAIVRSEAVALVARYHVNVLKDWLWSTTGAQSFIDVPPTMDLYKEIQTAKENGFISGTDNGNGTFSFNPNDPWLFGFHGLTKPDYFNVSTDGSFRYPPTANISRSDFVKAMYAYGKQFPQQNSYCAISTVTRCSNTTKCTMATFQSDDNGTHPLGAVTTTPDVTCNFDPADASCQSAIQAGTGSITATNCTFASGGTCTLNWTTSGITTGLTAYIEAGNTVESVPPGAITLIAVGASGSKEVTNIGTQRTFRLRVGRTTQYTTSYNQNVDRIVSQVTATSPAAPTPTPTTAPKTYIISGVVTGGTATTQVILNVQNGAAPPVPVALSTSGSYTISNLSAGTYLISTTGPVGQVTPSGYTITVGTPCTIVPTGTIANCGADGSVSKANFTIAAATIAAPTNLKPSGSIPEGQTNVTWDAVTNANRYELAIDNQTLNTHIAGCVTGASGCVISIPTNSWSYNFIAGSTYKVSVQAVSDTLGLRSTPTSVTITATATVSISPSPIAACNSSCTRDSDCAGASGSCTVCNTSTNTCQPPVTATNTPIPPTATLTPAPNHTRLAVSFTQHGIGLPADNANPNPTVAAGSVIPTPVPGFQTRSVTIYFSTGKTISNGVPVYEYQKQGTVNYTTGNGLYGYTGTIDIGTDIPSGQYVVAIRTNNSLSQQATGFASLTAGQLLTLSFPALISGNVYDTTIDNASPANDNQLDILDYNAIMDNWLNPDLCSTKTGTELQVCQTIRDRADLNADGTVDVLDYNLFIRELSVQRGR